ncbi:MAG: hypothetical protein JST10_13765 [Bacteroidetes bacterium]|nr:hypothetical protein [Bacteroidota bacterium]
MATPLCIHPIHAQNNFTARNTIYVDGTSKGAYYSVNYDRVFSEGGKFIKSYRAGFTILSHVIAFPLGISFFTGHQQDHFEFGLTIVPYIEDFEKHFSRGNLSDKKIYIIPGAGYRYQKLGGGFFFKIIAGPVIFLDPASDNFWKMDGKVYPGGSIGAGISF